ncbi:helix-turn-helix transcriptional regulator [Fusobacterium massiliense]|uniref:helix-turn-helix domain-containing protein n=1 Tax=Fusobacterium massiliense TaxID=1852365 RepID=UPI0028D4B59E|nr:helix-turn-helix transcriptional regulator [Fusobacterium massiliense]
MVEIKDRIISLRKENRMTQKEMAQVFKVGLSTISMWEQGQRIPRPNTLQDICDYFNVDMDYLMGRSDIKNRYQAGLKYDWEEDKKEELTNQEKDIFSQLTDEELAKLEKFKNMSTVMFMNEGNQISDNDKRTLAIAYAEVLISQRKK